MIDPNDKAQNTWYVGVFGNLCDGYQVPGLLWLIDD
eukprot:COSAG06_NODE_52843_length_303_cov_1.078431_1_plen_35_part_01